MDNINYLGILLPRFFMELFTAILCGALLGMERSGVKRSVGLRDTILICLSATIFMMVGELIDLGTGEGVASDPGRLAGWIIGASGLLAASAAIRRRQDDASLTTATRTLVATGIGLIVGAGYQLLGLLVTGLILLTLTLLHALDSRMTQTDRPLLLKMTAREDTPELRRLIQAALERVGVRADSFRFELAPMGVKVTIMSSKEPSDIRPLLAALWSIQGVTEVEH